ncbi:hypothetical protein FRC12_023245 [Ceratobasidium sp. 428]|nr:hypothetical protein FRC12_023245 [Ceratobasidium sp. 428]
MIKQNTNARSQQPQPSTSTQASTAAGGSAAGGSAAGGTSGSAPAQPNWFVTMRRLPGDVDEALSQVFAHLLHEKQPKEETGSEPDEEDTATGEVLRDTRSEPGSNVGSEEFFTAANMS